MKHEAIVNTAAGDMTVILHGPAGTKPRGIIVFYQDSGGLRQTLYDMAARMASWGYTVAMPDLYYRTGRLISSRDGDHAGKPVSIDGTVYPGSVVDLQKTVTNEHAVSATAALLDWVDTQPELKGLPVGVVGYCMGGPLVVVAASAFPDRVRAGGAFYGVGYLTDEQGANLYLGESAAPLRAYMPKSELRTDAHLDRIRGELYIVYAELDPYATTAEIEPFHDVLKQHAVRHKFEVYSGVDHGFAFPDHHVYDKNATERHFAALEDLFARNIG